MSMNMSDGWALMHGIFFIVTLILVFLLGYLCSKLESKETRHDR